MKDNLFEIIDLKYCYKATGWGKTGREFSIDIAELHMPQDKIIVLKGHNGSGKSTLMKLLSGVISSTEGRIQSDVIGSAVLVHQDPYMFHSSVYANLDLPLKGRGLKKSERKMIIAHTLKLVGLEGFEERKAYQLSGGETKRCAIARALVIEPKVLFLDEPDAGIDHEASQQLKELIQFLHESGTHIVMSSHHSDFTEGLNSHVITLENGMVKS